MVEPLRHRQTKGAANRYAQPTAAAPHSDSTDSGLSLVDRADVRFCLSSPHNLSPHLTGRLVLPQPDVNRVPQQIVGRPGQKGDLSDKLRFDPMDAG
jgi:hypothetical protein